MKGATMDRAALIRRLRANAQVCRDEQKRETVTPLHKAELANDAREWDEAASALEADAQREAALKALCDAREREQTWIDVDEIRAIFPDWSEES